MNLMKMTSKRVAMLICYRKQNINSNTIKINSPIRKLLKNLKNKELDPVTMISKERLTKANKAQNLKEIQILLNKTLEYSLKANPLNLQVKIIIKTIQKIKTMKMNKMKKH